MSDSLEMTTNEKVDQITERIYNALDHIKMEYNMNYAEIIGILEIIKLGYFQDGIKDELEDNNYGR